MKSKPNSPPRCPACGSKSEHAGPDMFRCLNVVCRGFFDLSPTEGGDFDDRNPAARMERAEARRDKFARRS